MFAFVVGEAVVHSRSPTDSLCLEDAELPYDQVGYLSPLLFLFDPASSSVADPGWWLSWIRNTAGARI
jgi:hypothetical protein